MTLPRGVPELLAELGDGENGFGGTAIATGSMSMTRFLQQCVEESEGKSLDPGRVPQTVFWVIDDGGTAIGMVRMRHHLSEALLVHGGHIGFYIRARQRGHGYARMALALTLNELTKLGEPRALLTVNSDNLPSIAVIEANGGRLEDSAIDAETGKEYRRYWIDLTTRL
jgi:predicted acetyltransferase